MERFIPLIGHYRNAQDLKERLKAAELIICEIRPAAWTFIARKCPEAADDICQDTMVAIAKGMDRFYGQTDQQFWSWCYSIARNKTNEFLRKHDAQRSQLNDAIDVDDLENVIEASAKDVPMSAGEQLDLDYALNLLRAAKPPCIHYLWMHYIEGFTYLELAPLLGQTYNAVRMQINRCLELAQSLVAKHA